MRPHNVDQAHSFGYHVGAVITNVYISSNKELLQEIAKPGYILYIGIIKVR